MECACGKSESYMARVIMYENNFKVQEHILCPSCFVASNTMSMFQVLIDDEAQFKQLIKFVTKEARKVFGVNIKLEATIIGNASEKHNFYH